MDKILELENKINEIKQEFEELKKLETNKRWKPKHGDSYWFITDNGKPMGSYWTTDEKDIWRFNTNNLFKTEEQARQHLENIKNKNELRALAEELNSNKVLKWCKSGQLKYYIYLDCEFLGYEKLAQSSITYFKQSGNIYCLDKYFLDKAIERIGEERLIEMIKSGV